LARKQRALASRPIADRVVLMTNGPGADRKLRRRIEREVRPRAA
jgi:hypothetical protein